MEMSDRASLFAKGSFLLRDEKRALLESLDEGVITLDGSGRISYINGKAEQFLKSKREDFLGLFYDKIEMPFARDLWKRSKILISEVMTSKEKRHFSFAFGQETKVYLDLIALPSSKKGGVILILQDHSNQQKILEVGKDFIANASHELRTPVTIIKGFAETLKDLPEVSEDIYESILEKIIRNCERMESLVKNLLTLEDLENSPLGRMSECDLIALMEDVCHMLLNVAPSVCIEQLYNEDVITVWAEPTLLELAFVNLLKNAVKYGPQEGCHIKITIEKRKDAVQVDIADNGIGIPENDLPRIFDRFYTVNKAHSRKLGGAGLGLSIVKTIMEKHQAEISVDSHLHQGTTFRMIFPTF